MQTFPQDWDILTKINRLQRKILLNSILYYDHNMNALTDEFYDNMCKQLVSYQHIYNRRGDIKTDSMYGYIYYDFDGSTGYHLSARLTIEDARKLDEITYLYLERKRGI